MAAKSPKLNTNTVNNLFSAANALEALNIIISFIINRHFYSNVNNSGCGYQHPTTTPTLLIVLMSGLLLGYGLVRAYKSHYSKSVTIVATFSWIGLSLIALIALSFHICF